MSMLSFFPDMQRFATRTLGPQTQKGASPHKSHRWSLAPQHKYAFVLSWHAHIYNKEPRPTETKRSLAPKITRMEPRPAAQVCFLSFLTCADKQPGVSPRANKKKGASPHSLLNWSLAPQQKSAFVVSLSWRARIHTKEPRPAKTKMGASPR